MTSSRASSCVQIFPDETDATRATASRVTGGTVLTRQEFSKKGNLFHNCDCLNTQYDNTMEGFQQFRSLSDRYLNYGRYPSRRGWSNAVWSFGALLNCPCFAQLPTLRW